MARRTPIDLAKVQEGDAHRARAKALGGAPAPTEAELSEALEAPDFDTSRFYLGKLCPKGHRWRETNYSLRHVRRSDCRECAVVRRRLHRQRTKQPAAPPAPAPAPAPAKKATGRPKGRTVSETLALRLSPAMLEAIDRFAERMQYEHGWAGPSRSHAVRLLLQRALEADES